MTHLKTTERPELPGIDALRLGACLVIAAYHAHVSGISDAYLPALNIVAGPLALAPTVTSLFLVLSGFVLAYAEGKRRAGSRAPHDFWRARAARLLPLMWLGHLLMAPFVLVGASRLGVADALVRAILALAALQAWWPLLATGYNNPAWSLSVLALGYALFPWRHRTAARLGTYALLALMGASWAAAIATAIAVLRFADVPTVAATIGAAGEIAHMFPPMRVLEFVSGVLLGHLWMRTREAPRDQRIATVAALGVAAAVALMIAVRTWPEPARMVGYGALVPAAWALTWAATTMRVADARVLHAARLLGRASFPVYLLHDPMLAIINVPLFRGWVPGYEWLLVAAWFASLVPMGLAVDRWFVTPVAQWLTAPRAVEAASTTRDAVVGRRPARRVSRPVRRTRQFDER